MSTSNATPQHARDARGARAVDAGRARCTRSDACAHGVRTHAALRARAWASRRLVKSYVAKLGENIKVARFVRFNVGEGAAPPEEEE